MALTFERQPNGDVRALYQDTTVGGGAGGARVCVDVLTPEQWSKAVAEVSALPDKAAVRDMAKALHDGDGDKAADPTLIAAIVMASRPGPRP